MIGSLGKHTGKIDGPNMEARLNQQIKQQGLPVGNSTVRTNQGPDKKGWAPVPVKDIAVAIQPAKQENDVVVGDRWAS